MNTDYAAVEWCLDWASRHISVLPQELRDTFKKRMIKGVVLDTRFSGIEAPSYAAHSLEAALCKLDPSLCLGPRQGFTLASAGDMNKVAKQCLLAFSSGDAEDEAGWHKHGPKHIFGNLEDSVAPEALQTMREIVRAYASKPDSGKNHSEAAQKEFMRNLIWPLLQGRGNGLQSQAPCVLHADSEGTCPLFVPKSGSKLLRIHVSGTPCIDWSKRGKRGQAFGQTAIPYSIWMSQIINDDIHLGIHECTPDFPDWMLQDLLETYSSRAWRLVVIRICPSDLGLPFRRKRRYTVFFRSDKIRFTGSYGGFVDLFFRRCELSGDIFFKEGPGIADGDSKTKHECLQMYSELRRERIEANPVEAMQNICDLTQRPPFGSLDSLVPCFTTGSHIFNLPKGRFLAPLELLDVIGVPRSSPLGKLVQDGKISSNALRKVMGNTMAISCVGTVLLYVVCSTRVMTDDDGPDGPDAYSAFAAGSSRSSRDF